MTARRILENPFHVLGVGPDAGRVEIEGAGQKLLGMLELGFPGVDSYPTPAGTGRRTADDVRRALSELRDPDKRLVHEMWARLPSGEAVSGPDEAAQAVRPVAWPDALIALGWRRRG